MIDKSREFRYGDDSYDIDEYLRLFSGDNSIEIRTIKCRSCEETVLHLIVEQDETGEINDFDPWNSKDQRYLDSWVQPT